MRSIFIHYTTETHKRKEEKKDKDRDTDVMNRGKDSVELLVVMFALTGGGTLKDYHCNIVANPAIEEYQTSVVPIGVCFEGDGTRIPLNDYAQFECSTSNTQSSPSVSLMQFDDKNCMNRTDTIPVDDYEALVCNQSSCSD